MNELDAIRARRAAITPGVWNVRPGTHLVVRGPWIVASVSLNDAEETRVTAEFIAAAPADVDTLLREVERLTGELARLRNGGKPEPTQEENDAAQERLRQMDVLHARHGNNTSTWPDYALEHYNRLQGAQNDYEAKYC
jgi:hypothetical protein